MARLFVILSIFLLLAGFSFSQEHNNAPTEDDKKLKLTKKEISLDIGDNGKDMIWRLDKKTLSCDSYNHTLLSQEDSIHSLFSLCRGTARRFLLTNRGLEDAGFENNLQNVRYEMRPLVVSVPVRYGNSSNGDFSGLGKYCDNMSFKLFGTWNTECDAMGSIVTPSCDTINNVLRIHHSRCVSMSDSVFYYDMDVYVWIAQGMRFPLLECCVVTPSDGGKPTRECFYYPPEEQEPDAFGYNILLKDMENMEACDDKQRATFRYQFSQDVSSQTLAIAYESSGSSVVGLVLANAQGMVYESISRRGQTEGSVTLSYAGLPHGQYAVRITYGNEIYIEKFTIK